MTIPLSGLERRVRLNEQGDTVICLIGLVGFIVQSFDASNDSAASSLSFSSLSVLVIIDLLSTTSLLLKM